MVFLLLVSLIWAFSFGLIKGNLTGLDSNFVAFCRMFVSLLIFLPFLKYALRMASSGRHPGRAAREPKSHASSRGKRHEVLQSPTQALDAGLSEPDRVRGAG